VIKDSIDVKADAFEHLFLSFGRKIANRVREHHQANGGVSRFDKIPLYLRWAGEPANLEQVVAVCEEFSKAVVRKVIDSPWIPGVQEYLRDNHREQYFVLVTATPQHEIEKILDALELTHCFREIFGAPTKKAKAIKEVLKRLDFLPAQALMVGDSDTDLRAAKINQIPFVLSPTKYNRMLERSLLDPIFKDFSNE